MSELFKKGLYYGNDGSGRVYVLDHYWMDGFGHALCPYYFN